MFEVNNWHFNASHMKYVEAACLEDDDKPVGGNLATGSICTEVDTGDVYFYDAVSGAWIKQFSLQPEE